MESVALFCDIDDFCQHFEPAGQQRFLAPGVRQRQRQRRLCLSAIMTSVIAFPTSPYREFKAFYVLEVLGHWRAEFPRFVSYSRFVEFLPSALGPLSAYLRQCSGSCTGLPFVDAPALAVGQNRRIAHHRVFADFAARGKTSLGWFFGFKLHLLVNDRGDLLDVALPPGNSNDRKPVPRFAQRLFGQLFADNGYLSGALTKELLETCGGRFVTPLKRKMQNRLLPLVDKLLLCKRAILETLIDQLKNISQIEHARHRSVVNFFVNLLGGLMTSCHQPKKPSLHLTPLPVLEAA